ncbi:unnamed protein product [Allacma fusca]|uniref:Cyclase n=1 Tax=Allacma fusca TaxID=39272 RepID=A0A8J2P855_9HEXA|nr:unnamed protein product [Allacma fusca]
MFPFASQKSFFLTTGMFCLKTTEAEIFIDLSYTLSNNTIYYPGSQGYTLSRDSEGIRGSGALEYWYAAFSFCTGEHGGTHLDAPYHFFKNGWTVEQIPNSRLINVQATLINVEEAVKELASPGDFKLEVEHLIEHEKEFGGIEPNGLFLVYTGWSKFWPDKVKYLGYENKTEDGQFALRFPGISEDAIKWLVEERQIVGIGLDTPSTDQGMDQRYPVHLFAASRQVYNLENVANLHQLLGYRRREIRIFVLPLKIVGGTGAPARILAAVH